MKQCVCGRSKIYPYCDDSHKDKTIKENLNETQDSSILNNKDKD
jgi:CDGSH-type Zn-finger protein